MQIGWQVHRFGSARLDNLASHSGVAHDMRPEVWLMAQVCPYCQGSVGKFTLSVRIAAKRFR